MSYFESEFDLQPAHDAGDHSLVDLQSGDAVLQFAYDYLKARLRAPTDDEVHNVMASVARYKGPSLVRRATLESFVAGRHGNSS